MPKFRYKFESVKKVKEALEKKAQKEVALIDIEIKKLEEEFNALMEEELLNRHGLIKKHILAGEIKFKKGYELYLQKKRAVITEKINSLKDIRKLKLQELLKRSKEHKIFNMLEENHLEVFNSEQNKIELDQINDIATQKFVRQSK